MLQVPLRTLERSIFRLLGRIPFQTITGLTLLDCQFNLHHYRPPENTQHVYLEASPEPYDGGLSLPSLCDRVLL